MTNLLTQPYRRPRTALEDNYLVTLSQEVNLRDLVVNSGQGSVVDLTDYLRAHPDGSSRFWSVGVSRPALRAWEVLEVDDLVLFFDGAEIYAYGFVASKTEWPGNNFVWPSGSDWDTIYSLRGFHEITEGQRPEYQALRTLMTKLDVQSVGCRSLDELGLTTDDVLQLVLHTAPRRTRSTTRREVFASTPSLTPTMKQANEASESWNILVELAAKGETTTYVELGSLIGIHRRTVRTPLSHIQAFCQNAGLPPLTVLVVNASTGLPGFGSIVDEPEVPAEQARVFAFDWTTLTNPFVNPLLVVEESYGEIEGAPVGKVFVSRKALRLAGVHRQEMGGISYVPDGPADAIVVSGGYVEDVDEGDTIIYTGQGGRPTSTEPASDQILHRGNLALMKNRDQGIPVRVIRGSEGDERFSPPSGYRYDGLFEVEDGWEDISPYGKKIYRFRLKKISFDESQTWTPDSGEATKPAGAAPAGAEKPPRGASKSTIRVIRDTKITRWVKRAHEYTCQFCATRLRTPASSYAEGAHIRPLGSPHDGADTVENMLCLCPNCHTLFDHGGLYVDEETWEVLSTVSHDIIGQFRTAPGHHVGVENLRYHRSHVAYS